jgi:hypothetical protein
MSTIFGAIDVETPKYQSIKTIDETCELREYPPSIRVEVELDPSVSSITTGEGFRDLANYIFGGNEASQKIAMTAPVVTSKAPTASSKKIAMTAPVVTETADSGNIKMSFILPSEYQSIDDLPKPKEGAKVHLQDYPAQKWLVKKYKGLLTDSKAAELGSELKSIAEKEKLQISDPNYVVWRYNPPWCLWFLRTNEVAFQIK